ncbi:MAG TPA: hypothetical protein VFJ47_16765 [Terriglobales bacterium]|nr:hypothetical protein [Terriglobales bacterium]
MRYPIDVETLGTRSVKVIPLGLTCALTGALIGILIVLTGYLPRLVILTMIPAGAIVGAVAGGLLGLVLCYLLFADRLTNRTFYAVTSIAAVVGILSALVFRVATKGEGGWLATFPTIIGTVVGAIWFRIKDPAEP